MIGRDPQTFSVAHTAKAALPTPPRPWRIAAGTVGTHPGSSAGPGRGEGTLPGRL